jgi:hypothetical protein
MELSDVDRRAPVQRADAAGEEAVRVPVILAVAELPGHREHLLELVSAKKLQTLVQVALISLLCRKAPLSSVGGLVRQLISGSLLNSGWNALLLPDRRGIFFRFSQQSPRKVRLR